MEQTLDEEARSLLEAIWAKMLMLYAPIDGAADALMQAESEGTYALGFGLRVQYWNMWRDWKRLDELLGLQASESQWTGPIVPAGMLVDPLDLVSSDTAVRDATGDVRPRAPYRREQRQSDSQGERS